jgi:3-deoxy-D-manno-octulosonic-acid transferase
LLRAFQTARKTRPDLNLIIAPRHPQRFREVERLCQNTGLKVCRRTQGSRNGSWDILILDTIGELAQAYALCDAAFIGGSLVCWGGHNLLEPAYYRKPVFFGPYMHNFAFLAERFLQAGGARTAHEGEELVDMFLMKDEPGLEIMGIKAREMLDSLQGATERTLRVIESKVNQQKGK